VKRLKKQVAKGKQNEHFGVGELAIAVDMEKLSQFCFYPPLDIRIVNYLDGY
jgi:hypothetical protein